MPENKTNENQNQQKLKVRDFISEYILLVKFDKKPAKRT